ncbi:hypothetical protein GXW82_37655 [Streptacidiphilus sp. 4-A2]|nr:hypothetical protein [Streptacidiphilus sp. 4-A2]
MSNGPAPDQSTEPLPRRGAGGTGRIPTAYGPGNPVREQQPERGRYRVRPGGPNPPIPEAQTVPGQRAAQEPQGRQETPAATYPVRPGAPGDPAYDQFLAMSERKEQLDRRRRRIRWGAALVALCCLTAVCVALLTPSAAKRRQTAGSRPLPAPAAPGALPSHTPSSTPDPLPSKATDAPSTPARATAPIALLSSAATDGAPLDAAVFFPPGPVGYQQQSYTRALTTASDCAAAFTPPLAAVLARNGCRTVLRASYRDGTTAVTVGVAVFDSAAAAHAVEQQASGGNLLPLTGGGLPGFCHGVPCRLTVDAVGRYAYFTVAGYTTGKPVPADDTSAYAAGAAMDQLVFDGLVARARSEAPTAPAAPAAPAPTSAR